MPWIEWLICFEKSCREISERAFSLDGAVLHLCGDHARQLNQILTNILKNYR